MRRAIALASSVGDATHPNPNVGAVVLDRGGNVVGEGRHERAGGPHAEVLALSAAGDRAAGGTVVVTLEPCAHSGRTGPCAQAVVDAGIARVVFAVADPTPRARGGAAMLRGAGVAVEAGLLAAGAAQANERWLTGVLLNRPFVVWKVASTLDGRVAAADGTSRWISSPESRADTHLLRSRVDAIVAGVGTVLADDPALTVRDEAGRTVGEQPLRVDVDIDALLRALHEKGRTFVLLEGGPTLAGGFLRAGLVDRVVAYVAPTLLGAGPSALAGTGITTLADGVRLDVTEVTRCGPDVRVTARPRREEGTA